MKISKKTIVIVIVVVVVVWLLWKRRKANQTAMDNAGSGLSKYSVDDVIAAAGLTGVRAETVRKEVNYLNSTTVWRSAIEDKAEQKGRTYEQQIVIEALYAFHYTKEDAAWKISKEQFEKYWRAIDAM